MKWKRSLSLVEWRHYCLPAQGQREIAARLVTLKVGWVDPTGFGKHSDAISDGKRIKEDEMDKQHNHSSDRDKEQKSSSSQDGERNFWIALGRAFAGALIFAISLFMTMEMWWLGFYMSRLRLALFLVVNFALLIGLARVRGFKDDATWTDCTIDALIGYAVGFVTSGVFLYLFGVINLTMSWDEIIGKIALQSVPASIGAMLARSQLGESGEEQEQKQEQEHTSNYGRELFIMLVGALFVAFTVAPTAEMELIAYKITPWLALGLLLLSLVILHTLVYTVNFRGQARMPESGGFWGVFLRYSVVGYAAVLLTIVYILWSFGRLEGTGLYPIVMITVVVGVPGAIGAAAARLIL